MPYSAFSEDILLLPSRSKTSVYALILTKLSNFAAKNRTDMQQINSLQAILKEHLLNHAQSFSVLSFHLKQAAKVPRLSPQLKNVLKDVITALSDPEFKKSFDIDKIQASDLEARVQRQIESQLSIKLLETPAPLMWRSINRVSASIIHLIKKENNAADAFKTFLYNINGKEDNELEPNIPFAFAHFSTKKTLDNVVTILSEGTDFAAIMLIHFMFVRDALPNLKLNPDFFEKLLANEHEGEFGEHLRCLTNPADYSEVTGFFTNYALTPLYEDRGRSKFNQHLDNHLGIVIDAADRSSAPTLHSSWYPDCICQEANLDSAYVKSLVTQDIPYVSGPSGMTSIFMGALTLFGNFKSSTEKNYYLLAVVAFMVSGGLHSIHEVLSVSKVRLNVVPEYQISGKTMANYNSFFSLFSKDEQVAQCLESSWKTIIDWFKSTYPKASIVNDINDLPENGPMGCTIM